MKKYGLTMEEYTIKFEFLILRHDIAELEEQKLA
jgi:hypothetical protein